MRKPLPNTNNVIKHPPQPRGGTAAALCPHSPAPCAPPEAGEPGPPPPSSPAPRSSPAPSPAEGAACPRAPGGPASCPAPLRRLSKRNRSRLKRLMPGARRPQPASRAPAAHLARAPPEPAEKSRKAAEAQPETAEDGAEARVAGPRLAPMAAAPLPRRAGAPL